MTDDSSSSASSDKSTAVRVIVRVRPLLQHEQAATAGKSPLQLNSTPEPGQKPSVTVKETIADSMGKETISETMYTFDAVYDNSVTQAQLFEREVLPHVHSRLFAGQSATLFAYGMTGTGKSHTINGSTADPGLIPRTMQTLFEEIQDRVACDEQEWSTTSINLSFFELYNEKIYDLLKPPTPSSKPHTHRSSADSSHMRDERAGQDLPVREDGHGKVFVANLSETRLDSYTAFQNAYASAMRNRKISSTKFNATSSRAHTMMIVKMEYRTKQPPFKKITGKLQILDLAGNEDNRFSGNMASKSRMVESSKINNSLFVLGKVINSLNAGETRIPYRDSKLTRLLQDSLGGGNWSMMICNVSPNPAHLIWTQRTLSFAMKSRQVVNVIERCVQDTSFFAQIAQQREEEKKDIRSRLEAWRKEHGKSGANTSNGPAAASAGSSSHSAPTSLANAVHKAKRVTSAPSISASAASSFSSSSSAASTSSSTSTVHSNKTQHAAVDLDLNKLSALISAKQTIDPKLLAKLNSLANDVNSMKAALQQQQRQQQQQQQHQRPASARPASAQSTSSAAAMTVAPTPSPSCPLTPSSTANLARSSVEKAKVWERHGQLEQALHEYREAERLRPDNQRLKIKISQLVAKIEKQKQGATTTVTTNSGASASLTGHKHARDENGSSAQGRPGTAQQRKRMSESKIIKEEENEDMEDDEEEEEDEASESENESDDMSDYDPEAEEEDIDATWMRRGRTTGAAARNRGSNSSSDGGSSNNTPEASPMSTSLLQRVESQTTAQTPPIGVPATTRSSITPINRSSTTAPNTARTPLASISSNNNTANTQPQSHKLSSALEALAKPKHTPPQIQNKAKPMMKQANSAAPKRGKENQIGNKNDMTIKNKTAPTMPTPAAPIPSLSSLPPSPSSDATTSSSPAFLLSHLVSGRDALLRVLNTGNLKELMQLQTIGKKRAQLIMAKREEMGPYVTLADLSHIGLSEVQVEQFTQRNLISSMFNQPQPV